MIEKIVDFFKKQVRNAFHTVLKSFSAFLALMISILLIESLFFTVILSYRNNIQMQRTAVESTYDHHIVLSGLSNAEIAQVRRYAARSEGSTGHYVVKNEVAGALYIKLLVGNKETLGFFEKDTLEKNYTAMCEEIGFSLEDYASFTPLYTLEEDISELRASRNLVIALLTVLLTLILCAFYNIYINNEKFTYGLYAAFGGKTSRLCLNASLELWICALFALLPSFIISQIACYFAYKANGSEFSFFFLPIGVWASVMIITMLITSLSVFLSIRRLTLSEPQGLIEAQNNSNLVSSPRASYDLLRVRFPFGYEYISAIRFRKHYLALAISSAVLCVSFILGCFTEAVYSSTRATARQNEHDITVQVSPDLLENGILPDDHPLHFSAIKGVSSAHLNRTEKNADELAHLLFVGGSQVKNGSGMAMDSATGKYFVGDLRYIAATGTDTVAYLKETYSLRGDPSLLLTDSHNILIGSSFQNRDTFSLSVGDYIQIAVPVLDEEGELTFNDPQYPIISNTSGIELWKEQYEKITYTYEIFRVVGIIDDYPSGSEGIPIVFPYRVYERLTGEDVTANSINIKIDPTLSLEDFSRMEALLNQQADRIYDGDALVLTGQSFFREKMHDMSAYTYIIRIISYALLLFIPLNWFYSQWFFFKRRRSEFYALHSISAPLSRIRSIFLSDAVIMLPIGILSTALALGLSFFAQWIYSFVLPNFFQSSTAVNYYPSLPFHIYLIGLGLSFVSCLLSALFPYLSYRKHHNAAYLAEVLEKK